MIPVVTGVVWLVAMVVLFVAIWRKRRRRGPGVGSGTAGAFYEMLSEDKRNALEIVVEQGAGKRRPEYPDETVPPGGQTGVNRS
ncbi:MAG TPA: hypothetical protein VLT86_17025 [Vicinamibacterales bacterium]|nr:hypothetical protein [Vicinamibacterales bacterium]